MPLPAPVPPLVTVIQAAPLDAVQLQPPGEATDTDPLFAVAGTDCDVGVTEKLHVVPACVTSAVCPPTDKVALRTDDEGLASLAS